MLKMVADRYEIIELIGQGGMADVYLAKDIILDRTIALKVLRTSLAKDPMYVMRFQREANAVASITDKNIVEIYDVGQEEGMYYIVMEYVPGATLKELIIKRGAVHVAEAIDVIKQVASGITHAHEVGIIHRDLKPQNILVTQSGIAKIADFGIASMDSLAQVTQTDIIMGSLHYLAPEIARGEKASAQSDIYALGIVLYELLRGEVPFKGESPVNIAMKHMQEDIPSVREFNQTILQSVENIIIRATAKNLNDRYQTAHEMYDDLCSCLTSLDDEKVLFKYDLNEDPTIVMDEESTAMMKSKYLQEEDYDDEDEYEDDYDDEGYVYLFGKPFRKRNVIISSIVALVLLVGVGVFAFGGKSVEMVEVPIVAGFEVDEARVILEELGFVVSEEVQATTSDVIENGLVVDTDPSSGENVELGSTVTLLVSIGQMILIDDYVGEHIDDIQPMLEEFGFTVIVTEETNDQDAGIILSQDIVAGSEFEPDGTTRIIKLSISSGKDIVVGNYVGLDIDEATTALEELGFKVTVKEESSLEDVDTVIEQNRDPGTIYKEGDSLTITLTVSVGMTYEVPRVDGLTPSAAASILKEKGFVVNIVDLGYATSLEDVNVVVSQYPEAYTIVTLENSEVEIRYYSMYVAPDVEFPSDSGDAG